MNNPPVCAGQEPARIVAEALPTQLLMAALDVAWARRAHHAYLQLKKTAWIGPAHTHCADLAQSMRRAALRSARTRLARVNGCDQPVSARGLHAPKTPATGAGDCRVAAVGGNTGDDSSFATLQQSREAVV